MGRCDRLQGKFLPTAQTLFNQGIWTATSCDVNSKCLKCTATSIVSVCLYQAPSQQHNNSVSISHLILNIVLCTILSLNYHQNCPFFFFFNFLLGYYWVGLGGLGIPCSPGDPRFMDSNPAEVDGFFQVVKILCTSPPGGTSGWGSRVWD